MLDAYVFMQTTARVSRRLTIQLSQCPKIRLEAAIWAAKLSSDQFGFFPVDGHVCRRPSKCSRVRENLQASYALVAVVLSRRFVPRPTSLDSGCTYARSI